MPCRPIPDFDFSPGAGHGRAGVIVESEQRFLGAQKQRNHVIDLVKCERLPANVNAVVDERVRFVIINRLYNRQRLFVAAQARLPGNCNAVKRGGNSICCQLPVGFKRGDIEWEQRCLGAASFGAQRHHRECPRSPAEQGNRALRQSRRTPVVSLNRFPRSCPRCSEYQPQRGLRSATRHFPPLIKRSRVLVMFRLHEHLLARGEIVHVHDSVMKR